MSKDFYSVLGLSRDASESDIKKAYRQMSKKWHPDKHKGDKDAEQKFKEINEAYEVLGNAKRKQQYDQFGTTGGPGGPGGGFGGFDFSGFQQGDFNGFGDIFESFFGGGAGGRRRKPDNRGADLQVRLTITFAESVSGVQKEIALDKEAACETCSGTGATPGTDMKQCDQCGGTGQVTHTANSLFGTIQQTVVCDQCAGAGQKPEKPCGTCGGHGRHHQKTQVTIEVPAGIDDGQTLRITGQGAAGKQGAVAGDLFVIVQVQQDRRFVREGDDIRSTIEVPMMDAVLGAEVEVETVDGSTTMKVPAGLQPGQVMRLKNMGMPVVNTSRRGDHFVTVQVVIPRKLSRDQKRLAEEWREKSA